VFGNPPIRILVAILAALALFPALAADADPTELAVAAETPLDRDALWRSIFARPEVRPVDENESKRRALGAELFSDRRLSGSGTRACSTCHRPELAYTDGRARAAGLDGASLRRNTPHLWNLAEAKSLYWDGRESTLESQARVPLHAANELAVDMPQTIRALSRDTGMARAFAGAFPGSPEITEDGIVSALAAFERSLVSPQTRFDAWVAGDDSALDAEEKAGFSIFVGKGGCVSCHGGWRMTDDQFHDVGVASDDPGRGGVEGGTPGIPAFKTPGLRQVAHTAPYMHDGSLATLGEVVAHYAGNRVSRPSLSPNLVRDLQLDPAERASLVAFLRTL